MNKYEMKDQIRERSDINMKIHGNSDNIRKYQEENRRNTGRKDA